MFRNARFNARGTIDVEIDHPKHGWIPFTANPDDPELVGAVVYYVASQGEVAPYVPPPVVEVPYEPTETEKLRAELEGLKAILREKGVIDATVKRR
jgi:hypothetical protein